MTTLREHLEAIRERHYRSHQCIGPCDDCRTCRDAVAALALLNEPTAAEAMARLFHETYERLAPFYNYRTRDESAVPWSKVPPENRTLMIETCRAVLRSLGNHDA